MTLFKWLRAPLLIALVASSWHAAVSANETITYTYDARGRVIAVNHAGTVNNGTQVSYNYDAADNRTLVSVNGASNNGQDPGNGASALPTRYVVVPLNGFTLLRIR